jgi:hypothetical protein
MKYSDDDEEVYVLKSITPSDPIVHKVMDELDTIKVPTNFSRMNSGVGQSIALGKVNDRFHHTTHNGRYDEKYPELKKAIWALGHKIVPFDFSTVQVNHNYRTKEHTDSHNVGMSLIVGLGDYSGGDLIVSGKAYSIKYKPTIFNGSIHPHKTANFKGERYSLVFFRTPTIYRVTTDGAGKDNKE